jgi:sRNA-binding regulator protein Hfq
MALQSGAPLYHRKPLQPTTQKPVQQPTAKPLLPATPKTGGGNNQPAQVKPKSVAQPTETFWLERQRERGAKLDFYFLNDDVLDQAVIVEFCRYALVVRAADGSEQHIFKHALQRIRPAADTKEQTG